MFPASAIGIALPMTARVASAAALLEQLIEEVEVAERAGFGLCMIPEHRQGPDVSLGSPLTIAGALAGRTSRITIATGVLLAGLHHPVHLAEQVTTLDHLSNGRFVLGVGAGYQESDFAPFGISLTDRVARLEDVMRSVRLLLTETAASYHGPTVSFADVATKPRPLSEPCPPMWLGAWSTKGVQRAAALADGWIADPIRSTAEVARMATTYRHMCAERGATGTVVVMREAWIDDDDDTARRRFAAVIEPIYRYYRRRGAFGEGSSDGSDVRFDALADRLVFGSPATCAQQIAAIADETGANRVVLQVRHPAGPDHPRTTEAIRALGDYLASTEPTADKERLHDLTR